MTQLAWQLMQFKLSSGLLYLGLIGSIVFLGVQRASAGGGPENVCLVVNPNSLDSMIIANHYMHLRHIPPVNVLYIPWDAGDATIGIGRFRQEMLKPILQTLVDRKLDAQVDYVVFSSDFPWRIDFDPDIKAMRDAATEQGKIAGKWPKSLGTQASLTGLVYLYQRAMLGTPAYVALDANRYMRPVVGDAQTLPTMGLRSNVRFDESGQPVAEGGERYLLACLLAVIQTERRRGTTVPEALAYLKRSVAADGTQPAGKIFFTMTTDIRTTQRSVGFAAARKALGELGLSSEIVPTDMPIGKNNVLGLTSGVMNFVWSTTQSTLLPGALCDNLTSFAGDMSATASQTPLTEFLRGGAAGSCGTVTEPYLNAQLLAKFPSPMLHAHYARGCSMAEAFYQSLHAPYQQLIVGDALCQPFARIPRVKVEGLKPGQPVRGVLTLMPTAEIPPKAPLRDPNAKTTAEETRDTLTTTGEASEQVDHFELFVDGVRQGTAKPGEPLSFDTATLGDGYHEARVVAVGPAPIFTQGREIVWFIATNHGRAIRAAVASPKVRLNEVLTVHAESPDAKRIDVHHNGRIVGTIHGASGIASIKATQLGQGFNYLQVVGVHGDQAADGVFARPIVLWIE